MTFTERLRIVLKMHNLIKMRATGSQKDFARKLGISRSAFFRNLEVLRNLGAPIVYDNYRHCYYYEREFKFIY